MGMDIDMDMDWMGVDGHGNSVRYPRLTAFRLSDRSRLPGHGPAKTPGSAAAKPSHGRRRAGAGEDADARQKIHLLIM